MTTPPSASCGCPAYALGQSSMSRRRMLGATVAGGGLLAAGQMFGDSFRQVSYGAEPGGNVVVVLSLRGGSDGLSIVVPRGDDHDRLAAYRTNIVVPEGTLLGADPRFGLHPSLAPLLPMWDAGTMGAVQAVGLPAPNRSHFDAMEEVEDADPGSTARVGWINRAIGLNGLRGGPETAVSLGGTLLPTALVGPAAALGAYQVSDFGVADLGADGALRRSSLSTMWKRAGGPLGGGVRIALGSAQKFAPLVDGAEDKVRSAAYPDGPLQSVLANTAALIREDLGTAMIAIDYGDWDMHEGLGRFDDEYGWMSGHLSHFALALAAFFADLGAAASRVTVVTISEFGRRVEENGSGGVDHGYGNAMMLFGAGVAGGAVRGQWPGLRIQDLEDGDLAMRHDFRDVLWEVLAQRFSAISGQRSQVFPGLAPSTPIGVMR